MAFEREMDLFATEFQAATFKPKSKKVSVTIADYIAKKLAKWFKCSACKMFLTTDSEIGCHYFQLLSQGSLTVLSKTLAQFVCSGFAALDLMEDIIHKSGLPCRKPYRGTCAHVLTSYVKHIPIG